MQNGPKMQNQRPRDIAGEGDLGSRRYERYCAAFDRVVQSVESGYFLEAIAILDSLIWDRLSSRLGYISPDPVRSHLTTGAICQKLSVEPNSEFLNTINEIKGWVRERNEAMHATAKVFYEDSCQKSFIDILQMHEKIAKKGIRLLQQFDKLDTESRSRSRKFPASYPYAFFPDKRSGRSRSGTRHLASRELRGNSSDI